MKYIVEIQLNTIDSYMRIVILHDNKNTMKMYYLFLGVTYLTMFQKSLYSAVNDHQKNFTNNITIAHNVINTKYNFTTILHQYCGSTL